MDSSNATPPQVALTIKGFCDRYGLSRAAAFRLLKSAAIVRVKHGRRTLIPVESAEAWWQSLRKEG